MTPTIDDGRVTAARGDKDDVFSKGFICPKGASFAELDNDPDRLTAPLVRRDGELTEATWDEAFAAAAHTDFLVIIGANPVVSNGSLATAADFTGKLRALRKRGGRLVVIDPARSRTAELADRHIASRPGSDPALLLAVVQVLFEEGLVHFGSLADHCGVADEIRTLARELAAAPTGPRPRGHRTRGRGQPARRQRQSAQ